MKTPGCLTDTLFYLRTLTTLSVLSIGLQISSTVASILAENTSGLSENHQERNERLNRRVIGSGITDLVQN